jgi:hypothetical protein
MPDNVKTTIPSLYTGQFCEVFEAQRPDGAKTGPDDLLFTTPRGTPLSSKNLYNRELAPACDRIKEPRIFVAFLPAHHATLLTEVGESIKTAQALLGHSDLGTTLNLYAHVIPDSERRAVERVAQGFVPKCSQVGRRREKWANQLIEKSGDVRSWWARQDLNLGPTENHTSCK